jgi:hypothetical protein
MVQGLSFSNLHRRRAQNVIDLGLLEILQKDPAVALSPEEVVARLTVAPSNPDVHRLLGKASICKPRLEFLLQSYCGRPNGSKIQHVAGATHLLYGGPWEFFR